VRDIQATGYVLGDQISQTGDGAIGKVERMPPKPLKSNSRSTVLVLLANPTDTPQLRLAKEYRAIQESIKVARHRDQLAVQVGMAVRYTDLHDLMLEHRPAIVHFAGHGSVNGIALLDEHDRACPVPPGALRDLFGILGNDVRCVVLNACLSDDQAFAIARHIPCVVGMSGAVLDDVAIEFAASFYRAIADGASVATSLRLGRNRPTLGGRNGVEAVLASPSIVAEQTFITG